MPPKRMPITAIGKSSSNIVLGQLLVIAYCFPIMAQAQEQDNACDASLSGDWVLKEVANETDCDEGINTYHDDITISESAPNRLTIHLPGGSISGTRDGCSISFEGSISEDEGKSTGTGTAQYRPRSGTINGVAKWEWRRDEEVCAGTSSLVATPKVASPSCEIQVSGQPWTGCDADTAYTEVLIVRSETLDKSDYLWRIESGEEIVDFDGEGQSWASLQLKKPSKSQNDVSIFHSFVDSATGERAECSTSLTVVAPGNVHVVSEWELPYQEYGDEKWVMGIHREYKVVDQFGNDLSLEGLRVTEQLTADDPMGNPVTWTTGERALSINPANPDFVGPGAPAVRHRADATITDPNGHFVDRIFLYSDFASPRFFPVAEVDMIVFQDPFVEDCPMEERVHIFSWRGVEVYP